VHEHETSAELSVKDAETVMGLSMQSLKEVSVGATTKVYSELRQIHSNRQARTILGVIEGQRGPTDVKSISLANEYARDVLGSAKYAPWLHVYTAISGGFKEGWIPDNYYGLVVGPLTGGDASSVVRVKSFTNRILNTEALPDLAYVIAGIYYSRDFRPIGVADLVATLFDRHARVFFKADGTGQGRGVSVKTKADFEKAAPRLPDGVFQAPIQQHEFFKPMSPRSTATLRITTARDPDGSVSVKAAYLRGGRATDDIVACSSHVRVPVDKQTGALADVGYLHDWRSTDQHPDTGFRFSGEVIPNFGDVIGLCKSLHESCPHMLCLGWDTCVNQEGKVEIMEWNARYNDIKFSEATTGPCFRGLGWETLWRDVAA
jgi:putative polysaccharide biosynthesis protein